MIRKRSDLNGKVYGRRKREMLMPKEKSSQSQPKENTLRCSDPGINKHGFRRSPHLQAVMDRIEERRQLDREKELRWQAISRRRRDHKANNYDQDRHREGEDDERDLSDVLEVFAKYDNMLEHLVLKNMELVSLAEKKNREIPDDETVLTEKVLKDLRALRQFREEQLEHEPLQHFSLLKDECEDSSPRTARNPQLQFKRPNEILEDKQTSSSRARFTPMSTSTSPISSSFNRKQSVGSDEEIVDSFRPPRKSVTKTASIPESKDLLNNSQSRVRKIRELRDRQRKRKEAQIRKFEGAVNESNKGSFRESRPRWKGESEIREFQDSKYKTKEEQLPGPHRQTKTNMSQMVENREKETEAADLRGLQHSLGQAAALHKELEEMWCTCPLDLPPESRPRHRQVVAQIDSESDNDSFGPSRQAKKLNKRLRKIYQQSKSLRDAQEDMRGEMVQLQQGYKLKHNKLKRKFLRHAAPSKQYQNETRESEHFISPSEVHGHQLYNGERDDSISYEVRDGIIVLDDIKDDTDTPECEFLGVQNPHQIADLPGGNNYMTGPVIHAPDEMHGNMDPDFMQQPVMKLPFSPEEQAQYLEAEWTHYPRRVGVLQSHSHNHIGTDGDDTDDDDSLSYGSQSAYTLEHYRTRTEPAWNCATGH